MTVTSLYIYICVKHFGMANIQLYFSLATEKHNRRYKCSKPVLLQNGTTTSVIIPVEREKEKNYKLNTKFRN
jgi:hypothetical protein